ncbi:MAG: DUF1992 domain-containing protein [Chloroflexota bacterium]|nr:DUF1992 domain-containing protein [Chloroflexota bacterium]
MQKWEKIVDHLLQEAIGNGDISHLPGAGKPLRLDNNSHTPPELRAAHKILDDHNVIPDWIADREALDQTESKLWRRLLHKAARYQADRRAAIKAERAKLETKIEGDWKRFKSGFLEATDRYNRALLEHNLTLPQGIAHKPQLRGEEMIERALQANAGKADNTN